MNLTGLIRSSDLKKKNQLLAANLCWNAVLLHSTLLNGLKFLRLYKKRTEKSYYHSTRTRGQTRATAGKASDCRGPSVGFLLNLEQKWAREEPSCVCAWALSGINFHSTTVWLRWEMQNLSVDPLNTYKRGREVKMMLLNISMKTSFFFLIKAQTVLK